MKTPEEVAAERKLFWGEIEAPDGTWVRWPFYYGPPWPRDDEEFVWKVGDALDAQFPEAAAVTKAYWDRWGVARRRS